LLSSELRRERKKEKTGRKNRQLRRVMERVKITNLQIREKPDINGNYYYVIFNQDEPD
jgi:hypothetical protein